MILFIACIPIGLGEAARCRSERRLAVRNAGLSLEPSVERREVIQIIGITIGIILILPILFSVMGAIEEFFNSWTTWNAGFAGAWRDAVYVVQRTWSDYFQMLFSKYSLLYLLVVLIPIALAMRSLPRGLAAFLLAIIGWWIGFAASILLGIALGGWGPSALFAFTMAGAGVGAALSLYPRRKLIAPEPGDC